MHACGMSRSDIAREIGLCRERVRALLNKAAREIFVVTVYGNTLHEWTGKK
jgi:DNA-binding transcriptional regulator LsrR (DeoR family)